MPYRELTAEEKVKIVPGADLRVANLRGANLSGANLRDANLSGADLSGAYLIGANLRDANLSDANLSRAYPRGANLRDANLSGANLIGANLIGTDLRDANLSGANLRDANLSGADLSCAKNIPDLVAAQTAITSEGDAIGWKKCRNEVIVKLLIPTSAKRSNATGRKCRAESAVVQDVFGAEFGLSHYDGKTEYRKGKTVKCDKWNEDRWTECGGGIHYFLTRTEAEAYEM